MLWQCFSCRKRFHPAKVLSSVCPVCGSDSIQEILGLDLSTTRMGILSDAMAIDSLLRCGVTWPDIFNLVWGLDPQALNAFPKKYRMIVSDILLEMTKEEESYDCIDKKLHHIIVELLYVAYEKQVYDYIGSEAKKMNANSRRGA